MGGIRPELVHYPPPHPDDVDPPEDGQADELDAVPTADQLATSMGAEVGIRLESRYPNGPRVELTDQLRRQMLVLAQIHCTYEEISAVTEVSVAALRDHCRRLIDVGKQRGRANLRRRQYLKAVEEGNVQMLIWLGKNMLQQADRAVLEPATLAAGEASAESVEEAEAVMAQLQTRLDTIRHNREQSTERTEQARASAGAPREAPQRAVIGPSPSSPAEVERAGLLRPPRPRTGRAIPPSRR